MGTTAYGGKQEARGDRTLASLLGGRHRGRAPSVNALPERLPVPAHGSGPAWFARPWLHRTFTYYTLPVYPGARDATNRKPWSL